MRSAGEIFLDLKLNKETYKKELRSIASSGGSVGAEIGKKISDGISRTGFQPLRKEAQTLTGTLRRMARTSMGGGKYTAEFKQLTKTIKEAERDLVNLQKQQERLRNQHTKTDEYKRLSADIKAAEHDLDMLIEKQIGWVNAGVPRNKVFQNLDDEITKANARLQEMYARQKQLAENGSTQKQTAEWTATKTKIGEAADRLKKYRTQEEKLKSSGKAWERRRINVSKYTSSIKALGKRLRKLIPVSRKASLGLDSVTRSANKMKRGLFMGMGIRGMARLGVMGALVYNAVRGLREGMENLRQYDERTNESIQLLTSSLFTLKNALATAFAPILNAVAPIMARFIDWLTAGITAVAHFMAALTGQSQVVVARKAIGNVATAAENAAGSTEDANDAAKAYKKTLMGFDQINKLEPIDDSSSGSGGGGGSAGGATAAANMFETVPVSATMENWVEKLKQAWKNADFYDIGVEIGNKIASALENIPWDKIQNTAYKLGKSIATFLNGIADTDMFPQLGNAIAQAINTAIEFAYGFVTNFDFRKFGESVGKGISNAINNIDWKKAGFTLGELAKGLMNFLSETIQNIDWMEFGRNVARFIASIDWIGLIKSAFELAGSLVGAASAIVVGILDAIKDEFVKKFKENFFNDEGELLIGDLLKSIGKAVYYLITFQWFRENLFDPFIKGFKKAFGISSPSKEMEEPGENIIAGMLEGMINKFKAVLEWVKSLPGKIVDAVGKAGKVVLDFSANLIGTGWDAIKNISGKTLSYIAQKIGPVWGSISGMTGKTLQYFAQKAGTVWKTLGTSVTAYANYWAKKAGTVWSKLNDTVKGTANYYANKAGTVWKTLTKTLSATVEFSAKWAKGALTWLKSKAKTFFGKASGGVYKNGKWSPVQQYATGGNPTGGQLFVAREAGPELVGQLKGHTAVMNNDQIVASVSAGVAKAMAAVKFNLKGITPRIVAGSNATTQSAIEATTTSSAEVQALLKQLINEVQGLDLSVELDGKTIADNTVKHINRDTVRTGKLAFIV